MKRPNPFASSALDSNDEEDDPFDFFGHSNNKELRSHSPFSSFSDQPQDHRFSLENNSASQHSYTYDEQFGKSEQFPNPSRYFREFSENNAYGEPNNSYDQQNSFVYGHNSSYAENESYIPSDLAYQTEQPDAISKGQVNTIPKYHRSDPIVQNKYTINILEPLEHFKTIFSSYCHATEIQNSEKKYHAVVFNSSLAPSKKLLESLLTINNPYVNSIYLYDLVHIEELDSKVLVAITNSYDIDNNLSSFLVDNGPLDTAQLQTLITFIANLLSTTYAKKIVCGNINPRHILLQESAQYKLREFWQTYQGFEQDDYFLAPEILNCASYARHSTQQAIDIYAAGMTIFVAATGYNLHAINQHDYHHNILERGTFQYLSKLTAIPTSVRPLLEKLLANDPNDRYTARDLMNWTKNPSVKKSKNIRNTVSDIYLKFNNSKFLTPSSLAYALRMHWNEIHKIIPLSLPLMSFLQKKYAHGSSKTFQSLDFILNHPTYTINHSQDLRWCLLLLILDPANCINFANYSFTISSIPALLNFMLYKKEHDPQFFYLLKGLFSFSKDLPRQYQELLTTQEFQTIHEALFSYTSFNDFNCARLTYTINPDLPCLAESLINTYCTNINDLLLALDSLAQNKIDLEFDYHIIAFLAAKNPNGKEQYRWKIDKILNQNQNLSQWITHLPILSNAQTVYKKPMHHLVKIILPLLYMIVENNIRKKSTKKRLLSKLASKAEGGFISDIMEVMNNPDIFYKDMTEYQKMLESLHSLHSQKEQTVVAQSRDNNVELTVHRIGSIISSGLCLVICIILSI
ncbi:Serine/threonine-protein kinase [Rickettsiales endosymbiont of Paramecium tredecaurelia]|uniref:protein kinase domain-containing protein n=1 Tax=Candidatus Sarmatiella mevalonica TaxID=2770581 RepID=UPI0019210A6C|nr:hypothetical protein [Candidatus Sarmatiella mevalonica]MBL3284553.1 Serine/threonine-protein kinase [Candidatus Sarmatiella mevalonica]